MKLEVRAGTQGHSLNECEADCACIMQNACVYGLGSSATLVDLCSEHAYRALKDSSTLSMCWLLSRSAHAQYSCWDAFTLQRVHAHCKTGKVCCAQPPSSQHVFSHTDIANPSECVSPGCCFAPLRVQRGTGKGQKEKHILKGEEGGLR
jgi:hypothetical protein